MLKNIKSKLKEFLDIVPIEKVEKKAVVYRQEVYREGKKDDRDSYGSYDPNIIGRHSRATLTTLPQLAEDIVNLGREDYINLSEIQIFSRDTPDPNTISRECKRGSVIRKGLDVGELEDLARLLSLDREKLNEASMQSISASH